MSGTPRFFHHSFQHTFDFSNRLFGANGRVDDFDFRLLFDLIPRVMSTFNKSGSHHDAVIGNGVIESERLHWRH